VSAALTGALRAHAAGLYPDEAGTELLIRHGGILPRDDFSGFVHTGTSISDGTTLLAWIDWDAAFSALHHGQLPLSGGFSELCKPSCKVGTSHQVTVAARVLKARRG
jgi:hypothetical protein